jgi:hypothetical protein
VVGGLVLALGVAGVAVAIGIARRRGWARTAALAWYGVGVLQALWALAEGGLGAALSAGILPVVTAVVVFFYLTRPHVAAAFGAGDGPRGGDGPRAGGG